MTSQRLTSRQKLARKLWQQRRELRSLRNGVILAHATCAETYLQPATEMRRRTRIRLAKTINESQWCKEVLGYQNSSMPEI